MEGHREHHLKDKGFESTCNAPWQGRHGGRRAMELAGHVASSWEAASAEGWCSAHGLPCAQPEISACGMMLPTFTVGLSIST